jgi:hypothetical protein
MYRAPQYLIGGVLLLGGGVFLLLFKYGFIDLSTSVAHPQKNDMLLGIAGIVFGFSTLGRWLGLY